MTTCQHPIPVPTPGMPPTVRYVECQREAGHRGSHVHHGPRSERFELRQTVKRGTVRYPGAGASLLGDNPGVTTKEEANALVDALLGRVHRHVEPDGTVREG